MTDVVRAYYRAIDDGAYDELASLLEPTFTHQRPDRTIEGRETFLAFMRDERPETTTSHAIDSVFHEGDIAVQGRLLREDGSLWFGFVDIFTMNGNTIGALRTYTSQHAQ